MLSIKRIPDTNELVGLHCESGKSNIVQANTKVGELKKMSVRIKFAVKLIEIGSFPVGNCGIAGANRMHTMKTSSADRSSNTETHRRYLTRSLEINLQIHSALVCSES